MNIASLLLQTVQRYPDREALVFEGRRWTYRQWLGRIERIAQALLNLGIRPSDRVALYLYTCEEAATTYFACQLIGAVTVPMNFRLAPAEVAHILVDSGARALVYGEAQAAQARVVAERMPSLPVWIGCAASQQHLPGGHHLFERLAEDTPLQEPPRAAFSDQSLSALVYTSGTTGRPKGVMHSHRNDVAIATNCVMEYRLSHLDRALHVAPLYHVGGMQAYFIPHLMVGGTNVLMSRYDAARTLDMLQAEKITTLFAVPTQIQEMLFHPDFAKRDVSALRMITTGGAAIAASTMERVIREFCPSIYNGYGLTEASLSLLLQPQDALKHLGSCGKPTLITEARIIRHVGDVPGMPDDIAPVGEIGQLIVRGPQMTGGYWNNLAETERKIRHGWLYTGDLFSRDADGFYFFQGRADDMIVSGGENIYPREVEEVLYRCPGVKEAAVVGTPDPKWGSIVTAFIVKGDRDLAAEDVDRYCRTSGELAAFKRPRRIVFLDHLPTNPSGKVLRRELVNYQPEKAA